MKLSEMTNRDDLPRYLNEAGLTGVGVEVGVFEGDYAELLRKQWKGKVLFGVDPYKNYPEEEYRDGCNKANLEEVRLRAHERLWSVDGYRFLFLESTEAASKFSPDYLDFVFIDGNHRYESVNADLAAWWPKVKSGGIVGLHDFYTRDNDGHLCNVPKAVWEFCYEKKLNFMVTPCTSCWLQKP